MKPETLAKRQALRKAAKVNGIIAARNLYVEKDGQRRRVIDAHVVRKPVIAVAVRELNSGQVFRLCFDHVCWDGHGASVDVRFLHASVNL